MLNIKKTLIKVLASIKANGFVQGGHVIGTRVDGGTYTDVTVTFPKAFKNTPNIVVCLQSLSESAASYANIQLSIHTITKTSFVLRVFNANTSSYLQPAVEWIAVDRLGGVLNRVVSYIAHAFERGCAAC